MRTVDPRAAVLAGVAALWVAGLCMLTLTGTPPPQGRRVNRALAAEAEGNTAHAAEELDRVAAERTGDAGAWVRAGRALVADGRPLEGADRLAQAVALAPTSDKARYEWSKALAAGGLDDEAEVVVRELLARKPDHADGLFLAAALAARRGDAGAAAVRLGAAVDAGCSAPDGWRHDPRFDPVRADPGFLRVARDRRHEAAFAEARP